MIKLCYKQYPFKVTLKACKAFFDQTGLDLQTVFMKYIVTCSKTTEMGLMERLVAFSELYPRDIATKALYVIIKQEQDGVSLAEVEDATYRVSWLISERDDDISEPWPLVMLDTALQINKYFSENSETKKTVTSEE
tara:strand:- start:1401 stop:1808 length:408 start_codon:yes stop_codon:yes gene_type:complete